MLHCTQRGKQCRRAHQHTQFWARLGINILSELPWKRHNASFMEKARDGGDNSAHTAHNNLRSQHCSCGHSPRCCPVSFTAAISKLVIVGGLLVSMSSPTSQPTKKQAMCIACPCVAPLLGKEGRLVQDMRLESPSNKVLAFTLTE